MQISKTDFIQYLHCPKSFWLHKHRPDSYPHGEVSDYTQKLVDEGYEVEAYVRQLIEAADGAEQFCFQSTFQTENGLYAKADVVRENDDGTVDLYEIKSSTRLKTDAKHNQIKDACFQMIVAEENGIEVRDIYIVHLNGDYVRDGEIDPKELLIFAKVTPQVRVIEAETREEIEQALRLLEAVEIDERACSCLTKSKANHCDTFEYFNPDISTPSIYDLPRISKAKLETFAGEGRFDLDEIRLDEVTEKQAHVLRSAQLKAPVIDHGVIARWFSKLEYPIHFLDYETYASAIPIMDGARPHSPIPFQYSLHIKRDPYDLEMVHVEYLAEEAALPHAMVDHMQEHIGPKGSVISWHASFENTQNRTMEKQFSDKAEFLQSLIDRTLDLEDIFSAGYVDIAFGGSTSIKKVLPVLASDLDYTGMEVANGTDAMEAWQRFISMPYGEERNGLKKSMLEYCKLDTIAMVRIFEEMKRICSGYPPASASQPGKSFSQSLSEWRDN